MATEQFRVLPEHITLLSNAYVRWDSCEYGAPAIDSKSPYGNSSVLPDLVRLLEVAPDHPDRPSGNVDRFELAELYTEETLNWCEDIHTQTETALQVFLDTKIMQPGMYARAQFDRWARTGD